MKNLKKIIISRTDNIGDVVLTLPLAGLLKQRYPDCEIIFLARRYVKDVVDLCEAVDGFIDWEPLKSQSIDHIAHALDADAILHVFPQKKIALAAKRAKIKYRIGTNRRWYHWLTCNHRVNFSRKKSACHEAQLNLMCLQPLGFNTYLNLQELSSYCRLKKPELTPKVLAYLNPDKFNIIIHPGTNGNTREWSDQNFRELIQSLDPEQFNILVTGSEQEKQKFKHSILDHISAQNVMGKFTLAEFVTLIAHADALVAGSTGPVHIAGALNKKVIGLYPPCRGMNPQRWAPLGQQVICILGQPKCDSCQTIKSNCMAGIRVENIKQLIMRLANG